MLILGLGVTGTARADEGGERVSGYVARVPPEAPEAREARHRRVAERRNQEYLLLVHRGASRFAPENTMEAYAVAMDRGADGIEIDIRRSKDGVLYMFHDDTLDRTTSGTGKVADLTYFEILKVAREDAIPPTLAAVIELARQRAALLHLDIKESGIEDDIIRMFDEADIWDHVVHVNPYNSDRIRARTDIELHEYKGWVEEYLGGQRSLGRDLDDPGVREGFLEKPGRMLFIGKDPADGVRMLQREDPPDVPVPHNIRAWWGPEGIFEAE
jgi:hypothetical protein